MGKFARFVRYVKNRYDLLARKKYSTLAGTFVYFLVMSVMPLSVWLTILFGRMRLPVEKLLELPVFSSVENIIAYIRQEAEAASKGASVILIGTTLYSATGLFYHMRRGGEIIYGYTRKKSGWKVRVSALLFTFAVMLSAALLTIAFAGGAFLLSRILSGGFLLAANYFYLLILSFFLVLMLNAYVCPYKTRLKEIIKGTCFTVAAWSVALAGFAVFLKFGNTSRLYGAISTLIVFLLWLYVLMTCFVAGVAFNSEAFELRAELSEDKTL
ncbi:MAG: YihY/virulence factor BrkB family protein [Candidatus Borkfalkiaceae bacterium]|nr:YihY/virulence factor BrkB family protein [Clostridia bacterium]MDY6223231.1 YihY/virulence factor BrkB family protein [Christensenellaceae bacterium]